MITNTPSDKAIRNRKKKKKEASVSSTREKYMYVDRGEGGGETLVGSNPSLFALICLYFAISTKKPARSLQLPAKYHTITASSQEAILEQKKRQRSCEHSVMQHIRLRHIETSHTNHRKINPHGTSITRGNTRPVSPQIGLLNVYRKPSTYSQYTRSIDPATRTTSVDDTHFSAPTPPLPRFPQSLATASSFSSPSPTASTTRPAPRALASAAAVKTAEEFSPLPLLAYQHPKVFEISAILYTMRKGIESNLI